MAAEHTFFKVPIMQGTLVVYLIADRNEITVPGVYSHMFTSIRAYRSYQPHVLYFAMIEVVLKAISLSDCRFWQEA